MKNFKAIKIISIIITFILIMNICTNVFAAGEDDNNVIDFGSFTTQTDDSSTNPTPTDTPTETPTETPTQTPIQTPSGTTGNTSSYEESNIPYTGVESSVLMVAAFIVCAIIGIYTFKKSKDYKGL